MEITHKVKIDLARPGSTPRIFMVQGDTYTRRLSIALFSDRKPWRIPDDASVVVRYRKPDRTSGTYDTLSDGTSAVDFSGNILDILVAPEALSLAGTVTLMVTFLQGQQRLSTVSMELDVAPDCVSGWSDEEGAAWIAAFLPSPENAQPGQHFAVETVDENGHVLSVKTVDMAAWLENYLAENGIAESISISHEWDGTVLTVTSASGTSSVDLKGEPGCGIGISVMEYGAKGDGETDDTEAFQTALTGNRVLYVPGGTYVLSGGIVIGDNCRLELAQDAVLEFTNTEGNCITLGMLSTLAGNHATVKVPYAFSGNVLYAYSNDHTEADIRAVPPFSKWDPQWKTGRYVTDLNICKADSRGFHYSEDGTCSGTAVYISADYTAGLSTFMWGVHYSGLRIAGAFSYGIRAVNIDDGWLHEMRMDAFIDACEIGVSLEDCKNTYISAVIQPRQAYSTDGVYTAYAKHGIQLIRSKNTDLSGSRIWDWNSTNTLYTEGGEYQHISMIGNCSGTILNDYMYHDYGDTRSRIYTDTATNLETLTILQEPITRWFKPINGDPYFSDGSTETKLVTRTELDAHFDTDVVKNFTDVLPTATDTDGTVFGDEGYQCGYLNGSGVFNASSYYVATGFIPCVAGQTLYVHDMTYKTYDGCCFFCVYDEDKNLLNVVSGKNLVPGSSYYVGYTATDSGFTAMVNNVVANADAAYVRFSVLKANVGANPMIAIDEEIKYTVEGFLADGVKVKGENVIGEVGVTTPDWVATKEVTGGDTVVIPEQTLSSGIWSNLQQSLQAGFVYDVYVDGVLYSCTAYTNGSKIYLGNPSISNSATTLPHNNEPFYIYWAGGTATSGMFYKDSTLSYPLTIKVTDHAYYVYDQMPVGYLPDEAVTEDELPDAVVNPSAAEIGQTIIVKEVDENGKPTAWEAADHQPRTHYSTVGDKIYLAETTLTLDDGLGMILEGTSFEDGTYIVNFNGVEYTCQSFDWSTSGVSFWAIGNGCLLDGELEDTGESFAAVYIDAAALMVLTQDSSMTETTISIIHKDAETICQIPDKYLPAYLPFRFTATVDGATVTANTLVSRLEAAVASGRQIIMEVIISDDVSIYCPLASAVIDSSNSYGKIYGFSNGIYTFVITPTEDGTYTVSQSTSS